MHAVFSPYLTSVSDSSTNTCQMNASHTTAAGSELSHTLLAVDVSHSLPVSTGSQFLVTASEHLQLAAASSVTEDQSVDRQSPLTQYPLSDLSSVLAEQTLVGSQTPCASSTEVTQYPLSDSSSDSSRHAAEPASLLQFRLDDSPDNVIGALNHETDNSTMTDSSSSLVRVPESSVQCDSERVNHCLLAVKSADEADRHDSGCMASGDASADTKNINNELADGQGKCDGNGDLLMSLGTNTSRPVPCSLSPINSVDFSKTVDTSDKILEPGDVDRYVALGTCSSHVKHTSTEADTAGPESAVLTTVNVQLASCYSGSESVTGTKALLTVDEILSTVVDLQCSDSSSITMSLPAAGSVIRPRDENSLDAGWASLPASVELQCITHLDVSDDDCEIATAAAVVDGSIHQLEMPAGLTAVTSDSAGVTDDKEQTGNQRRLLLMETLGTDSAECLRNVADGFEELANLSAAQTSVSATNSIAAHSRRPVDDGAPCIGVSVSDYNVNYQSLATELTCPVIQGHSDSASLHLCGSVVRETDRSEPQILASIESQSQHVTMVTEKLPDMRHVDVALPLEQDSESEFNGDDLGEDVKMILAKYRVRRAPIGSDSTPVYSSANVDNVLTSDAVDSLSKDASTVRDLDTYSTSSDDSLANRVKDLLIKAQRQNHTATLPTAASDVTSQSASTVSSVCSSRNTSVDYSNLSRELNEIQMNLDSMRNSEKHGSNSHYSSSGSPCIRNQVVDEFMRRESLALLLQQKAHLDESVQHDSVGRAGDSFLADECRFVSNADAATSVVKQTEGESVLFEHQREVSTSSIFTSSGTSKPLMALSAELGRGHSHDSNTLVKTGTDVKTVKRYMQPLVLLSSSATFSPVSVEQIQFADMSLPDHMSHKAFETLGSRTEVLSAVDDVEDMVSNIGSQNQQHFYADKLADGQNATVSCRDMVQLSAAEDDTVSEVSSIHTDIHQSESTSYTQVDDCRSSHAENTNVEAAVKHLEQKLSNLLRADRYSMSPSHDANSGDCEVDLLKQSTAKAASDQQIPAPYNDEYRLSETGLSQSYSMSCDLSPVLKHSSFNTIMAAHPMSTQIDKTAAVQFDQSTELQSSAACNDNSSIRYLDRNAQQMENLRQLRTEHEKRKGYKISNQLQSDNEDGRWPYIHESYSVSSNKEMSLGTQFVSTGDVQFMPLVPLPRGDDSSDNGSYDGDNELPLTDRQSYVGDSEVRCGGNAVVLVDETLIGSDDASCLHAADSTQAVSSYSSASVNLLQPYQ